MTTGPAMTKALSQIADAFRPERKAKDALWLNAHRVKELVQAGRYSFPEACRLLEIEPGQVAETYKWLDRDNHRMNHAYGSDAHGMTADDLFLKAFFSHEEACLESNVVSFLGAA